MGYEVILAEDGALVRHTDSGISAEVRELCTVNLAGNSPYCLATQYRINGGFVPEQVFVFKGQPGIVLETLKEMVDHFFQDHLKTDLYVKEVPAGSTLFPEEALRLYGRNENEHNNGTVGLVYAGRAK